MDADKTDPRTASRPRDDEKGISRKAFVVAARRRRARRSASARAGAAHGRRKAPATPKSGPGKHVEDDALLFIKGRIHTMDGSNRIVEEARIENGKFVEVGNRIDRAKAKVDQPPGPHGRPGDRSSRTCTSSAWPTGPATTTPIEDATSIAEVQALLASRRPDVPPGSSSPRWAAGTRTSWPSTACRRSRSSTTRSPTGRCSCSRRFTGPGGDEQSRQGVLRERLRRAGRPGRRSAPTA